jgi:hypothetical protein
MTSWSPSLGAAALAAALSVAGTGCGPEPRGPEAGPPPEKDAAEAPASAGEAAAAARTSITIKADWRDKEGGRVAALAWSLDEPQPSTVTLDDGKVPDALVSSLKQARDAVAARGGHATVEVEDTRDEELFEKGVTVAIRAAIRAGFAKEDVQYVVRPAAAR